MRIGIIGAGMIGGTLTRRLSALGHEVRVANSRAPETLAELAAETCATPVWAAERGEEGRIALPIAGADGPGKETVMALVDELGFDPVDAGPLEESWRQQPGTPVCGKDYDVERTRKALADAAAERPAEFRAA
jgi:predicted dinucleotide-binding enzyme